ncbi:MAG: hypothetical protein QOD39_2933 [Mycobacterium sp.]|nr:hypothetical protein [Mycobacterium sp.]
MPSSAANAVPGACPPICDAIPDAAWIAPTAIPLYPVYRWPGLAGIAVAAATPRFAFEDVCASPPFAGDPRDYAVAARAVVTNLDSHWQLRAQIVHWRGPTAEGGATASATLEIARVRLRGCKVTAPLASPSITTNDPLQVAAVIAVSGQRVMHQYLLAHPTSGTVVELAMWSTLPSQVRWPAVPDVQIFDALAAPLCSAYLESCR